jgi:pyruvate dehydrogenase kinase 2/3/4
MRRMLVSRISRRVLAEHHIALSETLAGRRGESSGEPHVGVIYTGLDVKRSIDKCAELLRGRPHHIEDGFGDDMINTQWPEVFVDGHVSTKFPYIREHLEYVSNFPYVLLSAVVTVYS